MPARRRGRLPTVRSARGELAERHPACISSPQTQVPERRPMPEQVRGTYVNVPLGLQIQVVYDPLRGRRARAPNGRTQAYYVRWRELPNGRWNWHTSAVTEAAAQKAAGD